MTIKEIRDAAKMTQQEMAFELGVSIRTIANWDDKQPSELGMMKFNTIMRFVRKHKINLNAEA